MTSGEFAKFFIDNAGKADLRNIMSILNNEKYKDVMSNLEITSAEIASYAASQSKFESAGIAKNIEKKSKVILPNGQPYNKEYLKINLLLNIWEVESGYSATKR